MSTKQSTFASRKNLANRKNWTAMKSEDIPQPITVGCGRTGNEPEHSEFWIQFDTAKIEARLCLSRKDAKRAVEFWAEYLNLKLVPNV